MCPDGVDDKREQCEASEEEHTLGQGHVGADLSPVCETYPPQEVGDHHATVECVDHHPLVCPPKQGARPAGLLDGGRTDKSVMYFNIYFNFTTASLAHW